MKNKKIKKLFAIFVIFMLLMNVFSNTLIVLATSDIASGEYGSITWNINSAGKLTVSGTGNYSSPYTKGAPWYQYRSQITSAEIDVTTGATDLSYMFYGCTNMVQVTFSSSFDTSLVTNMQGMFYECNSLSNINLGNFNTANVTDMSYMFAGDNVLSSLTITNFNTAKVTDMSNMFDGCEKVPSLNLNNFSTANVTSMRGMFNDCANMTSLNISSFNTANVTDMEYMFEGCSKLTNLDLSKFDTSKVTNMYAIFSGCSSVTTLNISSFNTANVIDMGYMFEGCSTITSIDTSKFDTSKVTSMYAMFSGCSNVETLNISSFNTAIVTDLRYFAYNCTSITSIDMSGFDISLVTKADNLLSSDINLILINAPKNLKVVSALPIITGKNWINKNVTTETYTNLPLSKTSSITLVLDSKSYSVTLNINGGKINSGNVTTYKYGVGATLPTDITKKGYTFGGWYENTDFSGDVITNITVTDEGDKTYYAKWDVTNYTITYDLDGGIDGGNPSSYTVETTTFALKVPTKDGYVFKGWTGSNGVTANKSVSIAKGTTGNLSYKANWDAISYSVTFYTNGGTINNGKITKYSYGVGATLPTDVTKTGYTFVGWFDNVDLTGNIVTDITTTDLGNKTYYAKWTNTAYTITYILNGGTINGSYPETYSFGTGAILPKNEIMIPTNVMKDGYTFAGWYNNSSFTGNAIDKILSTESGNKTYYAKWNPINYKITYDLDGGIENTNPTSYNSESSDIILKEPTKKGYTFIGWTGSNGVAPQTAVTIVKGTIGDLQYKANWKPITYTVKFDSNSGTGTMSDETYTYDIEQKLPTNTFTRSGWDFGGWSTTSSGTPIYADQEAVKNLSNIDGSTVTLYVTWKIPPVFYITYDLDGGVNTDNPVSYNEYDLPITLKEPTKEGYIFTGWTGSNGVSQETNVVIPVGTTGPLAYTAHWRAINYTFKYDPNGGTGSMSDTYCTFDLQSNLAENQFTKPGFNFIGWSTSPANSIVKYTDQQSVLNETKNDGDVINLYAVWEETSYKLSFIWSDGLDEISPVAYHTTYDTKQLPITLDNPTRTGYTFLGWVVNLGDTPELDYVIPDGTTGDLTYIAIWQPNTVTISYDLNGGTGSFDNQTKEYAKPINIYNTEPIKDGYIFLGWDTSNEASTVIYKKGDPFNRDEDTILYAVWKEDNANVTFVDRGSVVKVENISKGGSATPPDIEKTGYSLSWDKDLNNIQGDTIITAVWMPITYLVKYNSNNGTGQMNDSTYVYGEIQKLRKNTFIRDGYTFLGWSKSLADNTVIYQDEEALQNETSTNGDIINLYAVWDQNLYLNSNKYYIGDINPTFYESSDIYISRISPNTKLLDFKNNIQTNGNVVVYNNTNLSIDDNTYVGTGMRLEVTKGDEKISIVLVVTADLDGNGKCTITDLSIINQHLTGKITLTDARLKAADVDYNGMVSITDLSRLNQILNGKISL